MSDGSELPSLLVFDVATGSFTGTAVEGTSSALVRATDSQGLNDTDVFDLVVNAPEQSPVDTGTTETPGGNVVEDTSGTDTPGTDTAATDTPRAGNDSIIDTDAVTGNEDTTAGNAEMAEFEAVAADNLRWFTPMGNSLEVSTVGTDEKLATNDWYLDNPYLAEQFKMGNGKTLLDSQAQNLVSVTAGFMPPAQG